MRKFMVLLFAACSLASAESLASAAEKKFSPSLATHALELDYGLIGDLQTASLKFKLSLNNWLAIRATSRLGFRVLDRPGTSIKYDFSYIPSAELILRYPTIVDNIYRPFLVYDLNYIYGIEESSSVLAYSLRSGMEFYVSRNTSLSIATGVQLPLLRSRDAQLPGGGILTLAGSWYFD